MPYQAKNPKDFDYYLILQPKEFLFIWGWMVGPLGSIFGRKIDFVIFQPKIDLRSLGTIFWQILVENNTFDFFDQ